MMMLEVALEAVDYWPMLHSWLLRPFEDYTAFVGPFVASFAKLLRKIRLSDSL